MSAISARLDEPPPFAASARPRLFDALVMIAATAVGLALVRYYLAGPRAFTCRTVRGVLTLEPSYWPMTASRVANAASLLLFAWSPALLWIGIKRAQISLGTLPRYPGLMACAVATFAAAVHLAGPLAEAARSGWPVFDVPAQSGTLELHAYIDMFARNVLPGLSQRIGPLVATALLFPVLVLRVRCSPTSWAEIAARVVGFAWIVTSSFGGSR